jgi:hypothetical protein
MGFGSLQHLRNPRSTSRGLRPPATFRLQGLVTLLAVSSLGFRAGFVSHRQRSWDSPFGGFPFREAATAFPPRRNPPTVCLDVTPAPKRRTGHTDIGFWVHAFRKSLATERAFRPTATGASLGFCPSRAIPRKPCPELLPDLLSRALQIRQSLTGSTGAPECRSALAWLRATRTVVRCSELPFGGFRTSRVPMIQTRPRPGYCVHLAPCRTSLPDLSTPWAAACLTGVHRDRLGKPEPKPFISEAL